MSQTVSAATWVIDYTTSLESDMLNYDQYLTVALSQAANSRNHSTVKILLRYNDEFEQLTKLMEQLDQMSSPLGALHPVIDASGNLILGELALVHGGFTVCYHVDLSNRVCMGHRLIHPP